jgi:hypothetical protein
MMSLMTPLLHNDIINRGVEVSRTVEQYQKIGETADNEAGVE